MSLGTQCPAWSSNGGDTSIDLENGETLAGEATTSFASFATATVLASSFAAVRSTVSFSSCTRTQPLRDPKLLRGRLTEGAQQEWRTNNPQRPSNPHTMERSVAEPAELGDDQRST